MSLLEISSSEGAIATIVLNRPEKKNALSIALREEFTAALDTIANDGVTRVVVVTGAGSVFSAGFDLSEFQRLDDPDHARMVWESSDRFHHACLQFPLPMIAAVNGPALAGGFDLAVMCDLRIVSDMGRFAHPEITFGDVVYAPLHDLVGGAVARDLCFTGRPVDAAEALRLGLVSRVVAPADLLATASEVAAQIARVPRELLLRTKAKVLRRAGVTVGGTLDL